MCLPMSFNALVYRLVYKNLIENDALHYILLNSSTWVIGIELDAIKLINHQLCNII